MFLDGKTIRRDPVLSKQLALLRLTQQNDKLLDEVFRLAEQKRSKELQIRRAVELLEAGNKSAALAALKEALK